MVHRAYVPLIDLYLYVQFPVKQTNNHFEMSKQVEYHAYRVPRVHGINEQAAECTEQVSLTATCLIVLYM